MVIFTLTKTLMTSPQLYIKRIKYTLADYCRPRGLMDMASDFGSEDCGFESRRGQIFSKNDQCLTLDLERI